jgi:hypothetical protein
MFSRDEVLEYRRRSDVVEGFTWTDNDAAEAGSVEGMIRHYLPEDQWEKAFYFGGHRPVSGLYRTRAEGRYVQFHNPMKYVIAELKAEDDIKLARDIRELPDLFSEGLNEAG